MIRVRFAPAGTPLAWVRLIAGLFCWGVAVVLMVQGNLGLGPWDLFHQGISRRVGLPLGVISQLVGLVILLGALRLKVRPGYGTVANMILIGLFIDLLMPFCPEATTLPMQLLYYAIALPLGAVGSGLYIGARLGAGPRDSLMLALSAKLGRSVRSVRTSIELVALVGGWLLGGTIGPGTLLVALLVGPFTQVGLKVFRAVDAPVREEAVA